MDGDQELDPYAQAKQDFIQHFSPIVKVLTEDGMGHLETGDGNAQLKEDLAALSPGLMYTQFTLFCWKGLFSEMLEKATLRASPA
uniref:Uncharacterized protein n=1 Tax=Ursus maritimus TaxID=29073 RepID=A0A452TKD8_URSMA